jgi:hypothetical protein
VRSVTVLDVTAADYHADNIGDERPSLTQSLVKTLITKSPLHAWADHPKLNPNFRRAEESKFDLGTAAHQLLLEGEDTIFIVVADDWKTNAAKEARELARAHGRVPLLAKHADEVRQMVAAIWEQLAQHDADPPLFMDGKPEQTIVWEEDGVLCRARLDWLRDDLAAIDDLKSTRASAEPRAWAKTLYGMGADVQAAFYMRAVRAAFGAEPAFRFCAVECSPPFALSVVTLAPSALELANAKIDYAVKTWRHCLETGDFPGYDRRVAAVEMPSWEETRWLEREAEAA